ncbi:DUF2946 domain-containing protein [Metapseudomonas resinovorans]|uniref:DUF2946 domain-containing protein n=1 Tax=Metapseudomonas resinovorans NBRC 106553 TaxID=1245471 RepID=S6AX15_METRE|nr:DUF2946 domain-containing protein [Pseudomonas resinovorans]BAN49141.1 hypothetical protein PCA10_34090 [Pseudomonas resinovorans NBRC 106553]
MGFARQHRSLIAWMLYCCILFSAFVCAISHGQMSGLQLSGVGGLYCSVDGNSLSGLDSAPGDLPSGNLMPSFGCPLCSAFTLAIGLLFYLGWFPRPASTPRPAVEPCSKASPRCNWPPANPRAP